MQHIYDPFVLRRWAEGRIFLVNPQMPFEHFVYCFQTEQPFFMVSQLEDGRVAITPNVMFIPFNLLETGWWPQGLLPGEYEYVTMKNETYPVIVSAHPITNFETWIRKFHTGVMTFAKQTLTEFVLTAGEFQPLAIGRKFEQPFPQQTFPQQTFPQQPYAQQSYAQPRYPEKLEV